MSAAGQQEGKKDPTLNARAPKRKARGSRCPQGKGHRRRSKLTITNPDAARIDVGSRVHYVSSARRSGSRCRFVVLALTRANSMS